MGAWESDGTARTAYLFLLLHAHAHSAFCCTVSGKCGGVENAAVAAGLNGSRWSWSATAVPTRR